MTLLSRLWTDWAEEHWEAVGMALSIGCAVTASLILAVAFNVIATRLDGADHAVAPASAVRLHVSDRAEPGAI